MDYRFVRDQNKKTQPEVRKISVPCSSTSSLTKRETVEGIGKKNKHPMDCYMYILKCVDDSYYTGSTVDLEARIEEHNAGIGANFTSVRLPVTLVYCELFERIDEAWFREKQIQKWSRKKKEALINGDKNQLRELAKNYTRVRSES